MAPKPPSRRMTLGPVNANRRLTAIPEDGEGQTYSKKGRVSMAPRVSSSASDNNAAESAKVVIGTHSPSRRKSVGVDRRQSMIPPPMTQKPDPRPINEKPYINASIRSVHGFLVSSRYENPVSPKTLARPSGKEFTQIATFLLRKIVPSFSNGTLKFEDEVTLAFRVLGYPFAISKTGLVAAGSPHTWPAILAALTWLTEAIEITKRADKDRDLQVVTVSADVQDMEDIDVVLERSFFYFLGRAYEAFLAGNDARYDELEEELVNEFERASSLVEGEIETVTDTNAAVVQSISGLQEQAQGLPTLRQKQEDYATDLEKFHELVQQLDEHKDMLAQKVEERTRELQEKEQQAKALASEVERLKQQLEGQELSMQDADSIENETKDFRESRSKLSSAKEANIQNAVDFDAVVDAKIRTLDSRVESFNEVLGRVQHNTSRDLEHVRLTFHRDSTAPNDLFGEIDVDRVVSDLHRSAKESRERVSQYSTELDQFQKDEEQKEQEITQCHEELRCAQETVAKEETALSKERSEQSRMLASQKEEIDRTEEKIEAFRQPFALEAAVLKLQSRSNSLDALRRQIAQRNKETAATARHKFNDHLRLCAELEDHHQKALADLASFLRSAGEDDNEVSIAISVDLTV